MTFKAFGITACNPKNSGYSSLIMKKRILSQGLTTYLASVALGCQVIAETEPMFDEERAQWEWVRAQILDLVKKIEKTIEGINE